MATMAATPSTRTLNFSVLVEQYDNGYVAHCIETGLVASSVEELDAISKMSKLLVRQVQFALKHDRLQDIYHLAPKDVIAKIMQLDARKVSETKHSISCDHKEFELAETAYAPAC